MSTPVYKRDMFLSTGTQGLSPNASTSPDILTGITDPRYSPVLSIVPVSEYGNVSSHIRTNVTYDSAQGQWKFNIIQSINADSGRLDSREGVMFHWKVIGLKHVKEIGTVVIPQSEDG